MDGSSPSIVHLGNCIKSVVELATHLDRREGMEA